MNGANAIHPLVLIEQTGDQAKGHAAGDRVGLGWVSGSCLSCQPCLSGRHQLCSSAEQIIVGRHGGFADRVRANFRDKPTDRVGVIGICGLGHMALQFLYKWGWEVKSESFAMKDVNTALDHLRAGKVRHRIILMN